MKKIFTFLVSFMILISVASAQKNVLYITQLRSSLAEGAWPENNDVVMQMFNVDDNINLTVSIIDGDGIDSETNATVVVTGYDALIFHDAMGSGDNFWKSGFPGYLGTIPAPTLYSKMYALRPDKALTSGSGASNNWESVYNLSVSQAGHDLFKGIDVSSGVITVMKGGVSDDGSAGTRGLQYNTGNVLSADNTLLAYPEGVTDDVAISFSDIPSGSTIDDATLANRIITLAFNVGVTRNTDYENKCALTVEGLTLWRNAVYSLTGLTVPDSPVDQGFLTTDLVKTKVAKADAYGVSGGIRVPMDSNASIYSISGKVIAKNITENYVACPTGIYIVKIKGNTSKVIVTR